VVASASASNDIPRSSATRFAVWTTYAGSHGFPRSGTGARYGLSVSTRMRSSGAHRATSWIAAALLNVTIPENER
jgi:hypothetical protein